MSKPENFFASITEKWTSYCTEILAIGQQEAKLAGKRMVEIEKRYGSQFEDMIVHSGITDTMSLGWLLLTRINVQVADVLLRWR